MQGKPVSAFWSNQIQKDWEAHSCVGTIGKTDSEQRGRPISLGLLPPEYTCSFNGMHKYLIHYFVLHFSHDGCVWPITYKIHINVPFEGISSVACLFGWAGPSQPEGEFVSILHCLTSRENKSICGQNFSLVMSVTYDASCHVFPFISDIWEGRSTNG